MESKCFLLSVMSVKGIIIAQGHKSEREQKNEIIEMTAGIAIEKETNTLAALNFEIEASRVSYEQEIIMQRMGFDPAFVGGLMENI